MIIIPRCTSNKIKVLYDFLVTVKAAPHECVIRTRQTSTYIKAENEAYFFLQK